MIQQSNKTFRTSTNFRATAVLLLSLSWLSWPYSTVSAQKANQETTSETQIDGRKFMELMSFLENLDPTQLKALEEMMAHSPDEGRRLAAKLFLKMRRLKQLREEDPEAFRQEAKLWKEVGLTKGQEESGKDAFERVVADWDNNPTTPETFLFKIGTLLEWIPRLRKTNDLELDRADFQIRQIDAAYRRGRHKQAREMLDELFAYIRQEFDKQNVKVEQDKLAQLKSPSILFVGAFNKGRQSDMISSDLKRKLQHLGFQIDICGYGDITWDRIKTFNVLVMMWHPGEQEATIIRRVYKPAFPAILRFVEEGGGVFVIGGSRERSWQTVNQFIQPLGAEILNEAISDKATRYRQQKHYFLDFAATGAIADHPVTQGIGEFWYCSQDVESGCGTLALKLDETWNVPIRGNKTARSSGEKGARGTYAAEPPIFACRSYGKGRMALFAVHPSFWLTDPYHTFWNELCISRGKGFRLLMNSFNWLGTPSLLSGYPGGFEEPLQAMDEKPVSPGTIYQQLDEIGYGKPVTGISTEVEAMNTYSGLIGIYSALSKGSGGVANYIYAARDLGFDFVVFTEDYLAMNEKKWNKLVSECSLNSNENFLAMPGLEYRDKRDDTPFIVFGIQEWPAGGCFNKDGKGDASAVSEFYSAPIGCLMTPMANSIKPWFLFPYTCLEVISYSHGSQLIDRAFEEYLRLQANAYDLVPLTSHRIFSADELTLVDDFKVYVVCDELASVPGVFRGEHKEKPSFAYVSNGPEIHQWMLDNAYDASREEPWRLSIRISANNDLNEVIIYDGSDVYRVFKSPGDSFSCELTGFHEQQHYFTVIAKDSEGRKAISTCLRTSDIRQGMSMDHKRQTTQVVTTMVDRERSLNFVDGGLAMTATGDTVGGGILVPYNELLPKGLAYATNECKVHISHKILDFRGLEETAIAQRNIGFASGDACILDCSVKKKNLYIPTELADTSVQLTVFTPRPYSYHMTLVEKETRFKQDFVLGTMDGPELVVLRARRSARSSLAFPYYTYYGETGSKTTGRCLETIEGVVSKGGYVSMWPDFYGSVAIFPLSDKSYHFRIENGVIVIGHELPEWEAKKQTAIKDSFMIVRSKFGEEDDEGFDIIKKLYGFDGVPAYELDVSHGIILETTCFPVIEARDYFVEGTVTQAPLPNELGLRITGLNPNWDAVFFDKDTGELRRIGMFRKNSTGYVTVDTSRMYRFIIGNLITCQNEAVRLTLLGSDEKTLEIEAYNPQKTKITERIKSPLYPDLNKKITLAGGESKKIVLQVIED